MYPVYGHVGFNDHNQFVGDQTQCRFSHRLSGTIVFCQGIIERDFLITKARLFTSRPCCPNVLGKLDQLFEHLGRRDGVGVISQWDSSVIGDPKNPIITGYSVEAEAPRSTVAS